MRGGYFLHSTYLFYALLSVLCIWVIYRNQKFYLPKGLTSLCLFLILMGYGLSTFLALDKGMAFLGFIRILGIVFFFCMLYQFKVEDRRLFLDYLMMGICIMIVMSIVCIPVIPGFLIQNNRLGGFIQYANTFALLSVITLVYCLSKENNYWLMSVPFLVSGIILSYSRSVALMALVAVVVALILQPKEIIKKGLVLLIGLLLGYGLTRLSYFQASAGRIGEMTLGASELQTRFIYYKDGLRMFFLKPFGYGYLGYLYEQRAFQTAVYFVKFIHNSFLQVSLDAGIIGLLGFVGVLVISVLRRNIPITQRFIILIIIGHSIIDFDFQFLITWLIILLIITCSDHGIITIRRSKLLMSIFGIVLMVWSYFAFTTYAYYNKDYEISLAMYPYFTEANKRLLRQQDKLEDKVDYAEKIYEMNTKEVEALQVLRDYAFMQEDIEKAVSYGKATVYQYPLSLKDLETYSSSLLILLKSDIMIEELKVEVFEEIMDLDDWVEEVEQNLDPRAYAIKHKPTISMSTQLIRVQEEARTYYSKRESE